MTEMNRENGYENGDECPEEDEFMGEKEENSLDGGRANGLLKDWRLLLVVITVIAILIRALPSMIYTIWGSDFGIYYGLTEEFIETGQFYNPYTGWGSSYNYFPVLYVLAGSLHYITGMSPITSLLIIGPIFGGLCVTILFFIARSVCLSNRVSLMSAMILAVFPLHAYQTSHSAPLVMGHFFLLLSLLFFVRSHENQSYVGPLYASTIFLILSHHFSTYIYLITIIFILLWQNLHSREWTPHIRDYSFYTLVALVFTFSYWGLIARPVYHAFMDTATPFRSLTMVALCFVAFFMIFPITMLKRRLAPDLFIKHREQFPLELKKETFKLVVLTSIAIVVSLMIGFLLTEGVTLGFIVWTSAVCIIFGFAALGWIYTRRNYIHGWLIAPSISLVYSFFTKSSTLFPERHLEYMAEPLSILAGLGLVKMGMDGGEYKKLPAVILVSTLILFNVASISLIYTTHAFTREEMPLSTLNTLDWMHENSGLEIDEWSVVASDHMVSLMLHTKNFTTSNEYLYNLWVGHGWESALHELETQNKTGEHPRIEYVLLDSVIYEGRILATAGTSLLTMTPESYEKFTMQPFELVYRNCTYRGSLEEIEYMRSLGSGSIDYMNISDSDEMEMVRDWAELYRVNWTYIYENYPEYDLETYGYGGVDASVVGEDVVVGGCCG